MYFIVIFLCFCLCYVGIIRVFQVFVDWILMRARTKKNGAKKGKNMLLLSKLETQQADTRQPEEIWIKES